MRILIILFKGFKKIIDISHRFYGQIAAHIIMKLNGVAIGKGFKSRGIPIVDVSLNGLFSIGKHFTMNNGNRYNKIGRQQKCFFIVKKKAQLIIGNNVGIRSTALIRDKKIEIGDFVKIGEMWLFMIPISMH